MAPGSLARAARLHPVGLLDLAFGVIALCRGYSGGTRVSAAMRATQGSQRPGREGAGGSMEGHRQRRRRRCPRRKLDVGPRKSESIDGNFKERRLVKLRGKRIVVLVAVSAGIVNGVSATGSLGIKDDLVNAGAIWVDKPAFRENNLVWGRVVPDIPDFCRELVAALSEG